MLQKMVAGGYLFNKFFSGGWTVKGNAGRRTDAGWIIVKVGLEVHL